MGHTNSTANLALPQFIGTDKPTWLSDVNGAFAAIDTYAGNNDAALAIVDGKADTAIGDASSAVTTATNAATTAGNAATTATNANTIAGNALTVANGINSKVGVLTDLTTTDKSTVVNAINEVNSKEAEDIPYDNTGSGLTATDVQAAIDEVAQGGGGSSPWTEIGNQIGTSSISIPAGTSELCVYVKAEDTDTDVQNIVIVSDVLKATVQRFRTGYATSSSQVLIVVEATSSAINLSEAVYSGTDKAASSRIIVYAR